VSLQNSKLNKSILQNEKKRKQHTALYNHVSKVNASLTVSETPITMANVTEKFR